MRNDGIICPGCTSEACRRSRRRGLLDHLLGVFGARPWRCKACERRFIVWNKPLFLNPQAHCPRCGNTELQKVPRDRVVGGLSFIGRMLHFPAYRCDPCRQRFFSLKPVRRRDREVVGNSAPS